MNGRRTSRIFGLLAAASAVAAVAVGTAPATAPAKRTPGALPPDAVLTWNQNAVNAVRASGPPSKFQVEGLIYMSYVQAAVYDAVTKLDGRYEPYHDFAAAVVPGASTQAAVAAAADTILEHFLPDQAATVHSEYQAYLATLGGDVAGGVTVGQAAANDIIAFRAGDGLGASTPAYGAIGPVLPGQWQLQSPSQTAQTPWVATFRPFLLDRPSQFRAPPPPALTSEQYARDVEETKEYGALNSTVRTPGQTAVAYFWNANAVNQYNAMLQNAVTERSLDLDDAAHLFAMGELVTADAGIACFDSKYFYLGWRPITAIQHADLDGNPRTTADPSWTPLLGTPTHPEYPAAHACLTSALTDALAQALHTSRLDLDVPGSTNGGSTLTTTRHFGTVEQIQQQIPDARVWIGFHFRNSAEQGLRLGNQVAGWALGRYFGPARH